MNEENGDERWAALGRTLYDVSQLLESADGAEARLERVLERLGRVVTYERAAMLEARPGRAPRFIFDAGASADDRAELSALLIELFGRLTDAGRSSAKAAVEGGAGTDAVLAPEAGPVAHLAVPLIALDDVTGLLFVRPAAGSPGYSDEDVRALSLVAASVGGYFSALSAHDDLVELARERDAARRTAEMASRVKDDFLSFVSEELTTPLRSIRAWLGLLRATPPGPAQAMAIEGIERGAQQQAKLVDALLDLARIASAEVRLRMSVVEPAEVVRAALAELGPEAERRSISLGATLGEAPLPVLGDPDRIAQVVSILFAHAVDVTPVAGHVHAHLTSTAHAARLQLTARAAADAGAGAAVDARASTVEPFSRPSGERGDDALGTSMAIAKGLIELHGGKLSIDAGTLTVELPHAPLPREARALDDDSRAPRLTGIRVLLVDQDAGLRESLRFVLEAHGAIVSAVASSAETLASLERAWPHVVLFGDVDLRGEDVYDLMRQLTARTSPLRVASISPRRLDETARERAAGFRMHVGKPLEIATLVAAVAELAQTIW